MTMALQSVFAKPLHFGQGDDRNQAKDHESGEAEPSEDLEEGEIADDDDEEELQDKSKAKDKKEDACKSGGVSGRPAGADKGEHKTSSSASSASAAAESKRRDRRRTRKRTSDDEHHETRELPRKRRRGGNADDAEVDDEDDVDFEMMNARGHSPLQPERQTRFGLESGESDFESSPPAQSASVSGRRSAGTGGSSGGGGGGGGGGRPEVRSRPSRAASPRRRTPRGSSRDRDTRRRPDRERSGTAAGGAGDRGRSSAKLSNSSAKLKDESSICAFYMEGKCSRGSDCPYSHAALPPRKMELCKFYLMDCCAKKEKCLYMHKDFPCKFFHTGKKCRHSNDDCKFSHDPLSETTRAILIKHIETAPREILGDFPRLTREETIQAIDNHSPHPQSNGRDKRPHIPSLFELHLGPPPAGDAKDADGGDRQPNRGQTTSSDEPAAASSANNNRRPVFYQDTSEPGGASLNDAQSTATTVENSRSIWFGQLREECMDPGSVSVRHQGQPATLQQQELGGGVGGPRAVKQEPADKLDRLSTLPARQRQLFLRIQQQQREPANLDGDPHDTDADANADDNKWYSSDEEGERKSLSDVLKSIKKEPDHVKQSAKLDGVKSDLLSSNALLENINVADIAKALSSLHGASAADDCSPAEPPGRRDPRMRDPRMRSTAVAAPVADVDLRVQIRHDVDLRLGNADVDLRSGRLAPMIDDIGCSDVDLRRFGGGGGAAGFGAPAQHSREIEASLRSHSAVDYQVVVVDCQPLNYTNVRLSTDWAHLDPRLQRSGCTARAFTSSDPPAIPLGPASPDPVPVRHGYDAEAAAVIPQMRWPTADPRARDPRRAPAAPTIDPPADPRGKPGLLGAAPPGMAPIKGEETNHFRQAPPAQSYDRTSDSSRAELNRRDPRRARNTLIADSDSRSCTPPLPPSERSFR